MKVNDESEDELTSKDEKWNPKELYFHSRLSDPDESLDSDGLTEPIDRRLIDFAQHATQERPHRGGAGTESDPARKARLQKIVAGFREL